MADRNNSSKRYSFSRRNAIKASGAALIGGLAGCVAAPGTPVYNKTQAEFNPELLPYDRTYPDDENITMFRRGLRRLGYYPEQTVPDAVEINWQLPVNYIGHTAAKASPLPTPDGETVLIPADTGRVHAVTPNGEHKWTVQTGATNLGIHGTPAIVDNVAYIGGYDGDLYAFNIHTGEEVWRTSRMELDGSIAIGSSPAYWDGVIYVVTEYNHPPAGTMWAIDAASGQPLWKDDRPLGMPHPSTAIDPKTERMAIGSNDGVMYCWEFPSLEPAWEFETGAEIKGTTPMYEGGVFVGSWDGNFYRLDLEDGTETWRFETGRVIMSNPGIDPETGIVYMGGDDNHVHALDTETGEEIWSTNVGGSVIGSLTVTADAVLVGSYDTHLYALEKDTGTVRWRVQSRGHVTSEAVPHDGRIYYAERGDISGYWDEDEAEVVNAPGHAYCLVPSE
ncbi:PQQ-binding-like beta-propeller repeat protein [Halorubraceae archaeon YAN]|nr:PQQ-binding-like beta-propeller repeat protein [Halorubraceae archaeon YAN]